MKVVYQTLAVHPQRNTWEANRDAVAKGFCKTGAALGLPELPPELPPELEPEPEFCDEGLSSMVTPATWFARTLASKDCHAPPVHVSQSKLFSADETKKGLPLAAANAQEGTGLVKPWTVAGMAAAL